MKIELPEQVKTILRILNEAGYEAYAVGGCVRDSLLGRKPGDWDITTSARPEEVKACFRRTVDTGIAHGTVTVMMGSTGYEVTTYRIDGAYTDARHPESVAFTTLLSEDLLRRDFTVNAMAYNETEGLVDLFNGREDLENKVIRAVGEPLERFSEDALRIMRCIRFSAQLDFTIDEATFRAAGTLADTLSKISRERIRDELVKTLMSDHPERTALFDDVGAMPWIFPDFSLRREERLTLLKEMPCDRILRLCAFLSGLDKEAALVVLKDLKFDNDTMNRTAAILDFSAGTFSSDEKALRHLLAAFGTQDIERLLCFTKNEALLPDVRRILSRGDCISLKTLAVTGRDLMDAGMKPGREMGRILETLLDKVLDEPELNTREKLLMLVSQLS